MHSIVCVTRFQLVLSSPWDLTIQVVLSHNMTAGVGSCGVCRRHAQVLGRDVESDLRPVISFFMRMGMEVRIGMESKWVRS
jgi:hypothetical protein